MNTLLNGLTQNANYTTTFNGGITHKTTTSKVLDMFAMGGAYRNRSDSEVIRLFTDAYMEDKLLALKCLFYLRDVRGGQGERRFFYNCINWLAQHDPEVLRHNFKNIPLFGRWDDFFKLYGTKLKPSVTSFLKHQIEADMKAEHPSLLAKWLKSENTSSKESQALAKETREAWNWNSKYYRQTLSELRKKIDIVERKMSSDMWPEINYATVPSKAGFQYRKAFLRHDETRYSDFINSKKTKVKAATLYPYEVVQKAASYSNYKGYTEREVINKYWDNLTDYFQDVDANALAMVDTSGSMTWSARSTVRPIDVAISLGLSLAEKAKGPFQNHYISFSSRPQLIKTEGYDFVDKVQRIYRTNLCQNTNIQAAFDMLLNTALQYNVPREDMPQTIVIISDMEFDAGTYTSKNKILTVMEEVEQEWNANGYELPNLVYWNVNALQNNIPMLGDRVSFVSGFSPSIFETILKGVTGYDLMLNKLNSDRYESVTL